MTLVTTESRDAVLFDFRRPGLLSREQLHTVEMANETLARQMGTVLSSLLRGESHVTFADLRQVSYDEYVDALPNPSVLVVLALFPFDGASVFHLPLPVAMAVVDRLLGGPGTGPQPDRVVTEVEATLLRSTLMRTLGEIAYAYESILRLDVEVVRLESNPQFVQACAPSDTVLVSSFDVRVGGHEGVATLCTTLAAIQPVLEQVTARAATPSRPHSAGATVASLAQQLDGTPLPVSVTFDPISLSSAEIVGLEPGDLVPLHHPLAAPLAVRVGGVACFTGTIGQRGTRLACIVVEATERSVP